MALEKNDRSEGETAKAIEKQTAKLPSDLFLWAALASMGASATLKFTGHRNTALFVGQWASPFLLLGVYNKLVKLEGHDSQDKPDEYENSRQNSRDKAPANQQTAVSHN